METVSVSLENTPNSGEPLAPAKWAAVVKDTLVPMPRRRLKARDILFQAQAPKGTVLIRDLNNPIDVAFPDDAEVDLAEGNVFRLGRGCDLHEHGAHGAAPKLAFIVDDAWEVTTNPEQTPESLRGLFELTEDTEFTRDHESPNDEPIGESERVKFVDGPVFITRRGFITVKVNNNPVKFAKRRVTGLVIKQTAISQGVSIKIDFILYRDLPDGGLGPSIGDAEHVTLHECEQFTCVAPDDNS